MSEAKQCECGCGEVTPVAVKTDARKGHVKGEHVRFVPGHFGRTMKRAATMAVQQYTPGEQEITQQDMANLRSMDDVDAADVLDARLQVLERGAKRSFVEMGMICLEVSRRELWKCIVSPETGKYFHSLDAWIFSRLGVSRTSAYTAMRVLQIEAVSLDDLREMPRRNAVRLASLSSEVQRDPIVIDAAKHASEKAFVATVQERHPEQHVEQTKAVMAEPTLSARELMDECFEVVRWAYEISSREDVLENLCAFFMDGKCEREGYTNWTNREAFAAAKQRQVA